MKRSGIYAPEQLPVNTAEHARAQDEEGTVSPPCQPRQPPA